MLCLRIVNLLTPKEAIILTKKGLVQMFVLVWLIGDVVLSRIAFRPE
jgi:hypothetical protein